MLRQKYTFSARLEPAPIRKASAEKSGLCRMWEPLRDTPFFEDFENLYQKVIETLPAKGGSLHVVVPQPQSCS